MPNGNQQPTLGQGVELAYRDALDDWLIHHRKARSIEEMLVHGIRQVEVTGQLLPSRYGLVTVSITARDTHDDATYPFILQTTPFLAFKRSHLG